jgi:hypothetical protein
MNPRGAPGKSPVGQALSPFLNHRVGCSKVYSRPGPEALMPLGKLIPAALLAFGVAALAWPSLAKNGSAQRQNLFVITDQEGYGTGECLEKQGGCGKIIADSFCESKGFKVAEFFRRAGADELTGSISSERRPPPRDPVAFIIGCK